MSENMSITAHYRDINTITQAYRFTAMQAQRMAITYVVQMGQLLQEAKELLDDTKEFERWLSEEAACRKSTAYNYMNLAKKFGDVQGKIASLTYSQALALLALPDEEWEEFIEQNDVESMSTRELKKAIEERDAARKEAEAAAKKAATAETLRAKAEEQAEELERELEDEKANKPDVAGLERAAQSAVENSKRLEKSLETAKIKAEKVQKSLKAAEERERALAAQLKEAQEHPVIPQELLDKAGAEAAARALAQQQFTLDKLNAERTAAQAEAEKLRKQLAQTGEEVTICRTYLTDVTGMLNKVSGILLKLKGKDPQTAEKLKGAVKAVLTQWMEKL